MNHRNSDFNVMGKSLVAQCYLYFPWEIPVLETIRFISTRYGEVESFVIMRFVAFGSKGLLLENKLS